MEYDPSPSFSSFLYVSVVPNRGRAVSYDQRKCRTALSMLGSGLTDGSKLPSLGDARCGGDWERTMKVIPRTAFPVDALRWICKSKPGDGDEGCLVSDVDSARRRWQRRRRWLLLP